MMTALRITKFKGVTAACGSCGRSLQEGRLAYVDAGRVLCELCGCPDEAARIPDLGRDAVIKRIRAALKRRSGKAWSVTGGRGTGWGWIRISCPPARRGCPRLHEIDYQTNDCGACGASRYGKSLGCPGHTCDDTCYPHYMTPEDRAELAALLSKESVHFQGESIPSGSHYYEEYVDRAEGRTPRRYGEVYWD